MSARNSMRRCSSVLPLLAPPPAGRAPPSASTRRDIYPRSSLYDRALSPFSDFLSESDTGPGTPDFRSEESDSSAGSVLQRATAAASHTLSAEWERIERTLYEEPGEHVRRPQLLDECRQWRELVPHIRVVGHKIPLPEGRQLYHDTAEEEVIAAHYSDRNECSSESEERLSESSFSDTTPSNSPRAARQPLIPTAEPRLNREKSAYTRTNYNDNVLNDSFYSMLQITPLYPRSPPVGNTTGKRHYSSILKSEISSSKWMRNHTPDSPRTKCDRNSAKSFVSLNTRNCTALSANERKKLDNGSRIYTARQRDAARLQPLYNSHTVSGDVSRQPSGTNRFINGKVSLPPLHIDQEKAKVKSLNSARKNTLKRSRRSAAPRAITLISETKNFYV